MLDSRWIRWRLAGLAGIAAVMLGCLHGEPKLTYLGDADMRYYLGRATEIDYPVVATPTQEAVSASLPPHTIRDLERTEIRDMTLMEAIHIALQNNKVIKSEAQFLSPGNALFSNPDRVPSVYDSAIQDSGVLFGNIGVEAALAAFDAQLDASMIWRRNEELQNSVFGIGVAGGSELVTESAQFESSLQKIFAHGGTLSLNHDVNYIAPNIPVGDLFDSIYAGNVSVEYRQPLLAGAGTEYTRTAGPIVRSFGGITGVSQGVLIARINNDITLADFEAAVRNLLKDVEDAYWNLYLAYRNYDTAVVTRNSAMETWRLAKKQAGEVIIPADEAQARTGLYSAEAAAQTARSNIHSAETRLRRLLELPINDGTHIRPISEPVTAEFVPDWYTSLTEALTQRVELRRQKWLIKSLELQLQAARSLTRPRLDFVGGYQINGFGDRLLAYDDDDEAGTPRGLNSFYETITQGDQTGWNLGFQFNLPLGLRQAHAQVRNVEWRLTKAREVLSVQELEIGHELAAAFQELARAHATMQSNYQRYLASEDDIAGREPRYELGEVLVDVMVRAYERRAQAELAYYQSVVDYNKALADLQFRKGTLLEHNSVLLLEGPWVPEAYVDAEHHAEARAHAFEAHLLNAAPQPFASDAPVGGPVFTTEDAARLSDPYRPGPGEPQPAPPAMPPLDQSDEAGPTPAAPDDPSPQVLRTSGDRAVVEELFAPFNADAEHAAATRPGGGVSRPPAVDGASHEQPARVRLRSSSTLYDIDASLEDVP